MSNYSTTTVTYPANAAALTTGDLVLNADTGAIGITSNSATTASQILTMNGTTAVDWTLPKHTSLIFNVDGEEVKFEGTEILRLKQMLTKFIQEEHPEDLL